MKGNLTVTIEDVGNSTKMHVNTQLEEVCSVDKMNLIKTVGDALQMQDGFHDGASDEEKYMAKVTAGISAMCLISGVSYPELRKVARYEGIVQFALALTESVRNIINDKSATKEVLDAFYGE